MTTHNEERDITQHCLDPFPEPQTIPAGWDMSTILSASMTASAQQVEDLAESESN